MITSLSPLLAYSLFSQNNLSNLILLEPSSKNQELTIKDETLKNNEYVRSKSLKYYRLKLNTVFLPVKMGIYRQSSVKTLYKLQVKNFVF